MKRIGITANLKKRNAKLILEELIKWLDKKKKKIVLARSVAPAVKGNFSSVPIDKLAARADLIISLGGDGTLLRTARIKDIHKVPVLGVNLGGLGFITEVVHPEIYEVLEAVFAKRFKLEKRMRLLVKIMKKGKEKARFTALNELVLAKTIIARLLHLDVFIGNDYVTSYQSDGLIVSTPTGSTGHSLSAGGPIIEPALENIIVAPICPHTLTNRPLIISADKKIEIKTKTTTRTREICATIDGQTAVNLSFDESIVITKSPDKLKLIVSPKRTYYRVLREKLFWGQRGPSPYVQS